MANYLLDTNHLGAIVDGNPKILGHLDSRRVAGNKLGICVPVLCEYEIRLQESKRQRRNRGLFNELLKGFRIWPMDERTTVLYGHVYHEVHAIGRVLSQVDMMIAALARQQKLIIATTDRDFEALPDIKTENWLAS